MLEHRLQILIDDERHSRLKALARERVAGPDERRHAAGRRLLEAAPMPVPEVDELGREIEQLRSRRA